MSQRRISTTEALLGELGRSERGFACQSMGTVHSWRNWVGTPKRVSTLRALSIFKIGGWNCLQPSNQKNRWKNLLMRMNRGCCSEFQAKTLFLRIQCMEQHVVRTDLNVKEMMPLRERLHVVMQCYMRQHDACLHSTSWRESTRRKFTQGSITYFVERPICRRNVQKKRSESSEYMWKTTGPF